MKMTAAALLVSFASLSAPFCYAASANANPGASAPKVANFDAMSATSAMEGDYSTSALLLPDAPDLVAMEAAHGGGNQLSFGRNSNLRLHTGPFSQFALGGTFSIGGFGFQASTPLMTKMNLRVGGSMLNYSPTIVEEGIPIDGAVRMRSANVGVDIYPYRNSFHITPGVTLYNGNRMTATTAIAPGATFTINDTPYVSDPSDPVHGNFDVSLGKKIAPSLTIGFGNMLKRSSNWNLQTDFGIQYIGRPAFTLVMGGSVCEPDNPSNGCTAIMSDPTSVSDLQQEQTTINQDIQPLRFYPILTTVVSYRFGHKTATTFWR